MDLGENNYFSKDKNTVYVEITGYPRVDQMLDEDGETVLVITVEPLFQISPDKMKATRAVHAPLPDYTSSHSQNLCKVMSESGIVFGLRNHEVEQAILHMQQRLNEFVTFHVTQGVECGKSSDGFLEFALEIGPIAGKVLDDGSIDF